MKCREVRNHLGDEFQLTELEEKFIKALEKISKMETGRLNLMANGFISVRINDVNHDDNIDCSIKLNISCEGGDGGD
ncbi:hypothetical protein [Flavobacterium sp. DSR3-2]|uniref:hypothetical protein n=1 Tax=Flavobacterium sp. DSR3-2 TaxID=2804634 RepID=UPI003CFB34AE